MENSSQIPKQIEKTFDNKFSSFWIHFLSHNVFRTRFLVEKIGNINDALIIQAISWHHYLLSIQDNEQLKDTSFNEALHKWNTKFSSRDKKLTISNISDLTAIPFETVRRHLKKMVEKEWIFYSKKEGVVFNASSDMNKIIIDHIHPYEKDLIKKSLHFFLKAYLS